MTTPSQSDKADITKEFIKRTGNEALKTYTCASCALEIEASKILNVPLGSIPNSHLLVPTTPHAEHDIYHNMLLEPTGVDVENDRADICHECYGSLERNQLPAFALANNMWIGRVPDCLKSLTLVERLLIAKFLPTAYIVKLYPKQAGAAYWDLSQLYSGLKGSVSTYFLDPKLVASMIDGRILPAPLTILSAAMAVTFITPAGKTQFPLPKILHVRRQMVREALEWLKANNLLYKDIVISKERLQLLPEDGVPKEIQSTARHSTDIESVICEHEGYTPSNDLEGAEESAAFTDELKGAPYFLSVHSGI